MSFLSFIPGVGPILDGAVTGIGKAIGWLLANPKWLLALLVAIGLGLGTYKVTHHISELNTQITTQSKTIRDQGNLIEGLKIDIVAQKNINDNNQRIITQLSVDNNNYKKFVADLSNKNKRTIGQMDDLQKRLDSLTKADDGPIAKVLSIAVDVLQQNRVQRDEENNKVIQ